MRTAVESLEEQYPYLRGHIFIRVEGSRSLSCTLCGAFRSEHPPERQGSEEALPVAKVQSILAEINRAAGRS